MDTFLHTLPHSEPLSLPEQFTYPFHYTPHPLCVQAAQQVQAYLQTRTDWHDELQQGKMFGVLVVKDAQGQIGFLAAFSGNLAGSNHHPYFVPPVYDLLDPNGYFKQEEARITEINVILSASSPVILSEAKNLNTSTNASQTNETSPSPLHKGDSPLPPPYEGRTKSLEKRLDVFSCQVRGVQCSERRRREGDVPAEGKGKDVKPLGADIDALKEERKNRSIALQQWIFRQFRLRNAKGEEKDIEQIFEETAHRNPPAGTGECAAPKLLQHAYLHQMQPLAMAEFWWGNSPKGEIRHHGHYYPSCRHKCEPILGFMLQGLEVEPNPLLTSITDPTLLETVYEDEYLLVVNKPAGMLSVPGKTGQASVLTILQERYPEATGPILVHRLDMATSGLLLAAKDKDTHAKLQAQFESRSVKKRYIALLDGTPQGKELKGFIRLPLRPDYDNRPLQMVDFEYGKPAVTRYVILSPSRIAYYPETGRTHQLRVHSAHPDGMNCPIVGDPLYGQAADRLYLHAERLEFRHPVTDQRMHITKEAPF